MDFVKKHYEKILLGFVLLGLVGALVFLPFMIASDQQKLKDMSYGVVHPKATPLPGLDVTRETNVLERLQSPYKLDFSTTNKLFNSVQWQRTVDGHLIKLASGNEVGMAAVTKITPLYLILTLDSVETNSIETNELVARYVVSMERQASALLAQRGKKQHYASVGEKVGEKNDAFIIREVSGSPADPGTLKLIVQLTDTGERATLTKDKPFRRVDGYSADLKYDLEKPPKTWQGQRIGANLRFAGDDYIIVAIDPGAVILSARSNQKKTTLPYNPQNSE
jgi:hypothetical protein